jgi:hypothetical protein
MLSQYLSGGSGINGQISGLKIWNRILSVDEIDSLYNREKRGY